MGPQELLTALLAATKPSEVESILTRAGDSSELTVHEKFGTASYQWEFYGGTDSNVSSIGLGSKAGRSLTERVTNAIDAVLEKKANASTGSEPTSPMEAAQRWFGRPPSNAEEGLFSKVREFSMNGYDKLVKVVLSQGDKETAPTVDVVDDGIGIVPADFANTILSLQRGNKIKKRYLAGVFGQGGASTLSFSDYVLIASRHVNAPNVIGFTVIKLMRLTEGYKEDAYVYLVAQDQDGSLVVPHFETTDPLDLYPTISDKPATLVSGTLVRHYGYRLDGLEKTLTASPGNLYHLMQHMMFDPFLSFRILDVRKPGAYKDELITGSRNRLMARLKEVEKADSAASESEERGTEMRHHSPREMISPRSGETPSIGVEYWVPLNRRKIGDKIGLRSSSSELFIDKNHPIVGTMNGQNQGELTARILKDINLSMVAKHIVIHLDTSRVSNDVKRNLFTSTREGFKEGEVLNEVTRLVTNMLREDETLFEIEKELVESVLKKETAETNSEVKKEITKLLRDAGFEGKQQGESLVADPKGDTTVVAPPRKGHIKKRLPPLPTLAYPIVTKFEIVFPESDFAVHKQDNALIKIETDADFRFDREDRIAIRTEPPKLEVAGKGMLQGGRMNWRMRPTTDSVAGDRGQVITTLTKPDGSQLVAKVGFEVLAAREERAKREKRPIPNFDILPVDPDADRETFDAVWENVAQVDTVAYKAIRTSGGIIVYYNTAFGPYAEQIGRLKLQPTMVALFDNNYKIWIGYHAIIQQDQQRLTGKPLLDIQEEQLSSVREEERALVAEMQVKQALKVAELQSAALKQKSAE
jgi:hypothetical protein